MTVCLFLACPNDYVPVSRLPAWTHERLLLSCLHDSPVCSPTNFTCFLFCPHDSVCLLVRLHDFLSVCSPVCRIVCLFAGLTAWLSAYLLAGPAWMPVYSCLHDCTPVILLLFHLYVYQSFGEKIWLTFFKTCQYLLKQRRISLKLHLRKFFDNVSLKVCRSLLMHFLPYYILVLQ